MTLIDAADVADALTLVVQDLVEQLSAERREHAWAVLSVRAMHARLDGATGAAQLFELVADRLEAERRAEHGATEDGRLWTALDDEARSRYREEPGLPHVGAREPKRAQADEDARASWRDALGLTGVDTERPGGEITDRARAAARRDGRRWRRLSTEERERYLWLAATTPSAPSM